MPACAFIALGANLGDVPATVAWAMDQIAMLPSTQLIKRSSLYRSAPIEASGPDFVNAVVEVSTDLEPLTLLRKLQAIEDLAGRERPYRNAPRTLDLDLLMVDQVSLATPELTLPHPRMMQRAFVLVPLAEIAPLRVTPAELHAVQCQEIRRLA